MCGGLSEDNGQPRPLGWPDPREGGRYLIQEIGPEGRDRVLQGSVGADQGDLPLEKTFEKAVHWVGEFLWRQSWSQSEVGKLRALGRGAPPLPSVKMEWCARSLPSPGSWGP